MALKEGIYPIFFTQKREDIHFSLNCLNIFVDYSDEDVFNQLISLNVANTDNIPEFIKSIKWDKKIPYMFDYDKWGGNEVFIWMHPEAVYSPYEMMAFAESVCILANRNITRKKFVVITHDYYFLKHLQNLIKGHKKWIINYNFGRNDEDIYTESYNINNVCDNLITKNVLAFISHENVKICRELIDDVKNLKDEKGNINMEMFEKSNEIIKEFEYYLEN